MRVQKEAIACWKYELERRFPESVRQRAIFEIPLFPSWLCDLCAFALNSGPLFSHPYRPAKAEASIETHLQPVPGTVPGTPPKNSETPGNIALARVVRVVRVTFPRRRGELFPSILNRHRPVPTGFHPDPWESVSSSVVKIVPPKKYFLDLQPLT
jgi:hypothetical protein